MVDEPHNLFKPVYEAFARESPSTLIMRIVTERAFAAPAIDALFEATAERQYTRDVLFSSMVGLMVLVVTGARSSVHRAWQRDKEAVGTSVKALYTKLAGVEPGVDRALVRHTGNRCAELVTALRAARPAALGGMPRRIVDGMHIEASERRLDVLRDVAAGPRPGFALAVFDVERELVVDALFEPDAHAQERSRTNDLLALARPGECWIGDRNFCTVRYVTGLLAAGAHPLLRQHGHFPFEPRGARRHVGRAAAGEVYEQRIEVTNEDEGRTWALWRVTLELDTPTRDGDTAIHLITDLPDHGVDAIACAEAYGERWTIEGCFLQMATALNAEINALGYPPAALFGLAVGFCAYNVLSTVRAALRAAHGAATIDEGLSTFALVEEARGAWRGLTVMIAAELWARYHGMPAADLADELRSLARRFSLDDGFRKAKRGPKKPPPKRTRFKDHPHVATQRLLDEGRRKLS